MNDFFLISVHFFILSNTFFYPSPFLGIQYNDDQQLDVQNHVNRKFIEIKAKGNYNFYKKILFKDFPSL